MAAYFSRPAPEAAGSDAAGGTAASLSRWLITLKAMGVLPQQGRIVADIFATVPLLSRRPHALVLLDATAREIGPGSYRLNELKSALVVDNEGIALDLDRRIRDLLTTYTDAENGRIEPVQADGARYHRLSDKRLPAWAVTEWGTVDRWVIVSVGQGTFERMAAVIRGRTPSLADDAWYVRAHRRCSANRSGLEGYLAVDRTRKRLENVVNRTAALALEAVHLDQADRALMAVGYDGRALHSEVLVRTHDGGDHHLLLTGKEVADPRVLELIPDTASSFAAFRIPLKTAIAQAREAYYHTQSHDRRDRFSRGWQRIETEFGFDVEPGLLDQLGDHVIVHTYPPHPLGLPVGFTIWVQVAGDSAAVRRSFDAMIAAWQHYANQPDPGLRPLFRLTPQIQRDPDGIWYLQLGLVGPAMTVTDGWIVISFSPEAVRANLTHLRRATSRPAR